MRQNQLNLLLNKLRRIGIDCMLLKWFHSYLSDRFASVVFNGSKSIKFNIPCGVPQGSVLGPILFNVFINDLSPKLKSDHLFYADDLKLFSRIRSSGDCDRLQSDLNSLFDWSVTNKIALNIGKCHALSFTNRMDPLTPSYSIDNVELKVVHEMKDLGVLFDSKLRFDSHVRGISNRACRMLGFIMRTTKDFTNIKCILMLYNTLIRSHLEYCCTVWNPYQQQYIGLIEKVQRIFTRQLFFKLHKRYDVYVNRLKEFNMLDLHDRRKISDMVLLKRIMADNDSPLSQSIIIRNTPYTNRRGFLFRPPPSRTDFRLHRNPSIRCQNLFNREFNDIPLSSVSCAIVKRLVSSKLFRAKLSNAL